MEEKLKTSRKILEFLEHEGVNPDILRQIRAFWDTCPVVNSARIPMPRYAYYGKEVWEQALTAVLGGKNLLLAGGKATGKNVLAQNLAALFLRPMWNISLHVNTDAASLVGTDTFQDGAVTFRPGPVYECGAQGGFGVLDEINMAKNEALAVMHAVLDFRRSVDVPGYGSLELRPETRFIATMNYGYAGTREMNEALASRFAVIAMPTISQENLERLLSAQYPSLNRKTRGMLAGLFFDLNKKCVNSEISTRPLDLRGLLDAIDLMQMGLAPAAALDMGITNKSFDPYERQLVHDLIAARIPAKMRCDQVFDR